MTTAAADVVVGVAGYGLPGASPALPQAVLDDEVWNAVLSEVCRHHLTGHLAHAIYDGAFTAKDNQEAAAFDAHERALALALVLEQLLLKTVRRLDRADIATRVLRGASVAHTVYPEPGLRSFADIDVLVAQRGYDAALAQLCTGGVRRRFQEPRRGFERRFGKGVCLEIPGGLEIDLHRTLVAGPFGLALDTDALFEDGTEFVLGGQTLQGLDPEARFVDACFHAALTDGRPRLAALRDVAEMALCSPLDVGRLRERCRLWRCGIVVQRAIRLAWDSLALLVTPDVVRWSRLHVPTPFESRALDAYFGEDRRYARQAVAGLQALDGFGDKAMYAATLLFPNREYVRARDGSYARRAGRAIRLVLDDASERRRQASGRAPYG
jgi:hypothetical protein